MTSVPLKSIADSIKMLHHVALPVSDLARAERFYVEVLGAVVSRRRFDQAKADTGAPAEHISIELGGSVRIDLFPRTESLPYYPDLNPHFAFEVDPSEVVACAELLKQHHVPAQGPLRQGPVGSASLYFDDSEGNHLELVCHDVPDDVSIPAGPPDLEAMRYSWK